ncbi:MAG: chondroitinase family polysaccharide lyase [Paludibacter sp.]
MKKILFLIPILLVSCSISLKAQIYDFEDVQTIPAVVPAGFTTTYGTLQIATNKYKLGVKSLRWDWTANAIMTVSNPTGLSTASTTSAGGITCWIYNTVASSQKLTFAFLTSGSIQKCKIDFNLNFVGWRCMWAEFTSDMGHDRTACTTMTIAAPTTGSGTFYFDFLQFPSTSDWTRMSDSQVKVAQGINPPDGMDDYVALRNMNITPISTTPTTAESAGADTITKRLDNWYLGTNAFANNTQFKARKSAITGWISRAKTSYSALNLQPQTDGTILGTGLFNEAYTNSSYDGIAVNFFRDFGQNSLIPLAFDYRMNGTALSKTSIQNVFDWWNDQGWADGSAMGSLRFEKIRFGGYVHSLFLMRNDLGTTARLQREMNTLKWMSTFGYVFGPYTNTGDNTDVIRTVIQARLAYALMQTDPQTKIAALYNLRNYFNNTFAVAKGYSDCFKSDFTGYHHNGIYLGSYYPHALYVACLTYYLFYNTPYALSDSVFAQLKNNLLAYRKIASIYDVPTAACGRFPDAVTILDELYPCYAYLALAKQTPDTELLAAFERLYQPTVNPVLAQIGRTVADITFKSTLGEMELCLKAHALGVKAEKSLKTQIYYPYGGFLISRDTLRHTSIKGYSKYIWDYESDGTNNVYGRYNSYGQIEYTSLPDGRKNNAYSNTAFDWAKIPGTTAKYLSAANMIYTSSTPYRNFSTDPFLGGTTLNDSTSMFSLKLHDNTFDTSFYAYKSVFCFGNALICLGSNVTCNSASAPVYTTLLQHEVLTGESIKVNGTAVTANQTGLLTPVISDNLGNRFIVKTGTVDLNVNGTLYSAVINHGTAPKSQNYTYYMLLKSNDAQELKYKTTATSPIKIIRQDNVAHIVQQTEQNVWGYAIFNSSTALTDQWVYQVNSPSMLMLKQIDTSRIQLSISDPDMRRGSAANSDAMSDATFYDPGTTFAYQVVLNGLYSLDGANPNFTIVNGTNTTTLKVTVSEGKSYSVTLKNLSTQIDSTNGNNIFHCLGTDIENQFRIESSDNLAFKVNVCSIDGKIVKTTPEVFSNCILDIQGLNKGIYIIRIQNSRARLCQKVLVKE